MCILSNKFGSQKIIMWAYLKKHTHRGKIGIKEIYAWRNWGRGIRNESDYNAVVSSNIKSYFWQHILTIRSRITERNVL